MAEKTSGRRVEGGAGGRGGAGPERAERPDRGPRPGAASAAAAASIPDDLDDADLGGPLGAPLGGPLTPTPAERPKRAPRPPRNGWWSGTGRRKRAVARVRIRPVVGADAPPMQIIGTSKKSKDVATYFAETRDRTDALAPLKLSGSESKFEVICRVNGGGFMGQAGAIKMGLARALAGFDPGLEAALRDAGYLTRDAREVERKKYGQAGARRRFQFSKR